MLLFPHRGRLWEIGSLVAHATCLRPTRRRQCRRRWRPARSIRCSRCACMQGRAASATQEQLVDDGLRAGVRQHEQRFNHGIMALAALERRNDLRDQRTKCVGRGECLHFALAMPGPHHLSLARRRGGAAPPTERRETTFFRGLALSWRLESQRSACWVLGSSGVAPRAVLGTRVRLVRDCAWPLALPSADCSAVLHEACGQAAEASPRLSMKSAPSMQTRSPRPAHPVR